MFFNISARQLSQMCNRVGTSLKAGVDILRIWELEGNHGPNRQRQQMLEIRDRLAKGDTVHEAMLAANGYFPQMACDMVQVGEETGKLDAAFFRLSEHYEHVLELRKQFIGGIAWPAIQLFMGIFIIGMLILVLGLIMPAGSEEDVDLFGIGVGFRGLFNYVAILSTIFVTITFFVLAIIKGWFGLDSLLHFIVRLPVIGPAFQTMALSQMAWTLSMGLEAGVDAQKSMTMALNSTQTHYYMRHIPRVEQMIQEEGREFHDVLRATKGFPEDFVNSMETAEISGTASESMERLAMMYQERAKTAMKILTAAATFAIWGMVMVVLVVVIFRMFFVFILGPIQQGLDAL